MTKTTISPLAERLALLFKVLRSNQHALRDDPFFAATVDKACEAYNRAKLDGRSFTDAGRISDAVAIQEVLNERI